LRHLVTKILFKGKEKGSDVSDVLQLNFLGKCSRKVSRIIGSTVCISRTEWQEIGTYHTDISGAGLYATIGIMRSELRPGLIVQTTNTCRERYGQSCYIVFIATSVTGLLFNTIPGT
jgi:hypothetical protein